MRNTGTNLRSIAIVVAATFAALPALGAARVIVGDSAPALERFAAEELQRYLSKMPADTAAPLYLVGNADTNPSIRRALAESAWPAVSDQGIVLKRATLDGQAVFIVGGGSPPATLWAVYELVERWGVRFLLDRDVLPENADDLRFPERDVVLEPNLPIRQWRVMNAHACGPESWGLAQYRPLIDQLAKLKFNRLFVYIWPWHPFVHFEAGGIKRRTGTLWFGERYPITPDMPGRGIFAADETEFWNPDLPPPGSGYEQMNAAAERLLHELMAYAQQRGMQCVLVANLGEFPAEFAPLLKGAQAVHQIGKAGTIVPGSDTPIDDPRLSELVTAVLRATIETYPEADFIELGMQEHRQWAGEYQRAWKALDAKYAIEQVHPLARVLDDAAKRAGYPGGSARAVQEVKGDIVALYLYDRMLADGAARRANGESPRLIFDGVAEELFPVLPRMLPKGSELLNFIDYTPSRILRRREVLGKIPGREIPATLIYTLHDDNVGLLPELATHSLHELTTEIRRHGWAGFSTRYWLLGDHDPCIAYLAKTAWDRDATPASVYHDHTRAIYGAAAAPHMQRVFAEVEAATRLLEEHGLGFAFPTSQMMMQHWSAQPLPEAFARIKQHYRTALDAAQNTEKNTTPAGQPLARYWIGRLEFGIGYLQAVAAVRSAAAAEAAGNSDAALRAADEGLTLVRNAIESYARVTRDRSDKGAIAVMAEYVCRPLKGRINELKAPR